MVTADIITEVIAVTMSTNFQSVVTRHSVAGATLLIGLSLIWLAVPRVLAHLQIAFVPAVVDQALKEGRALPAPVIDLALARYSSAQSFLPSNALIYQNLGRLKLRQIYAGRLSVEQRQQKLSVISEHIRAAIGLAPASAFPWAFEAYIRYEMYAQPDEISDLLRMSYFLGPHEISSMLLRARVAGEIWTRLPKDVREFVSLDFAEIWSIYDLRASLLDIYLGASFEARDAIRRAIITDDAMARFFDAQLAKAIGQPTR